MEFRILGPLQVLREGRPVSLEAPKQQTLLAVLLLHANEVVLRGRLVDELWGDHPPATAVKTLHVHVSQLRKALGGDTIVTHGRGYIAQVEGDALDSTRFRSLLTEARRLHQQERTADAASSYRRALDLWRGDTLSDVDLEAAGRHEADGLDELRLAAAEEWIDCELALGRHAQVVAELERLVERAPYRERLREQLILALYRSGRQADALAAYRDARRILVRELGIEPTQPLQELERAILRQDPKLDAPAARGEGERGRPWRGRKLVGLAAAGLVVAGAVAVWQLRDSPAARPPVVLRGNSVALIDPATNTIAAEAPIGGRPAGLAFAAGSVWVGNRDDRTLIRIDPESREVVRTIGLSAQPVDVTAGAGDVWVVTEPDGTVLRIDPAINDVVARIRTPQVPSPCGGGCPTQLKFGRSEGWLSRSGRIVRIDPATNAATVLRSVDDVVWSIAYGEHAVWALSGYEHKRIDRIDPRTGTVTARFRFGPIGRTTALGGIVAGAGAVWTGSLGDTSIWKADPATGRVGATLDIGHEPVRAQFGEGSLWFATTDGSLVRVDPALEEPATTIPLGVYPGPIVVGEDAVWVTAASP